MRASKAVWLWLWLLCWAGRCEAFARNLKMSTRIVQTRYGRLQGMVLSMEHYRALKPIEVFLGVPYATPPVRQNRFSPTRTPSPWDGVRISDKMGPVCPQKLPNIANETAALDRMPKGRLDYLKRLLPYLKNQSEDCLYLNIYAPLQGKLFGKGEYDIIIIGAGSGGTILANRLSQVPFWKVLLLETGQNETTYTDVPQWGPYLQFSKHNWGYQTTSQTTCCQGMVDKKCNIPRGKILGGSSGINFMMYVRGNKLDYDNICQAGNPGWCYNDILPYFKQVEHSTLTGNVDPDYHGKNGTLNVEFVRNFGELGQAYIDGNVEMNLPVLDYNGKSEMGASRIQDTTVNGRRCSGNKAFVTPVLNRKNLEVVTKAFVTKIHMENNGLKPKARTVEFFKGGKKYYVHGKVEIILSAGAVGSPQILLHSGIGPKEDLEKLGIPVVKNLPVGANLHDHSTIIMPFLNNYTDPTFTSMPVMVQNYLNGFGYLTAVANLQSISFINTNDSNSSVPDVEQFVSPFFDLRLKPIKKLLNLENDVHDDLLAGYGNFAGVYIQTLLHPKSRGSIKLKSNNVLDLPLIDMAYYSNPDDFQPMIYGLKNFMKLSETDAMKKFNVSIRNNRLRVCPYDYGTDEYWVCHLRHLTTTLYHLAGTCKMGPDSDPGAVVNHELKVKGIDNLRVIDASILPKPISGHNNGPVMAIGAKAADLIKQERLGIPPSI